jgi:sortase A
MSLSLFRQIKSRYYIKKDTRRLRKIVRFVGLGLSLSGVLFGIYFFFPLISWKLYLEPAFASQTFASPIPKATIISNEYMQSLWQNTARSIQEIYDTNAQNWMPASPYKEVQIATQVSYYFISIPKLHIENAIVSTVDTDLGSHLVNFTGTAIPPAMGNAAVFGHSTLPPLFDPKNYKTIFANAHTLIVGDTILVTSNNITYTYKIYAISIVDSQDTSYLSQETDDSYLTLITCTPPGTVWKRLIIRSRLEKI